jgi:arabinan endo-1,5-alpha-L-arabinosidase
MPRVRGAVRVDGVPRVQEGLLAQSVVRARLLTECRCRRRDQRRAVDSFMRDAARSHSLAATVAPRVGGVRSIMPASTPLRRTTPSLLAIALFACGGGSKTTTAPVIPPPVPTATQYLNPVLAADFPDPAVLLASDGSYYAYATQTGSYRIQVASSPNLVAWTHRGEALLPKPAWASQSGNFWAPDVSEREGRFVMYYSTQIDASARINPGDDFCIGMATATTGVGPFVDVGHPVRCGPGGFTIDPMAFDDQATGKRWLFWGSGGSLVVQELAADRESFVSGSSPATVVVARGGNDPGAYDTGLIEGSWLTFKAPYYYLFFSGNNCCGSGAHYAVMVARSTSATGPFEVLRSASGAAAQPILQASDKWIAPGHNGVVRDAAGVDWMLYHAVDILHPYLIPGNTAISRRVLMLDRITYTNGWPVVGVAGVPTNAPQTRPTIP